MDLIRTELIVSALIAERRQQARHQEQIDALVPASPAAALAGLIGRCLMRVGRRLESIECDRLRVPAAYVVDARPLD